MRALPLKRLSAMAVGAVMSAACATSALAQASSADYIFFEDFGSAQMRVASQYVPSAGVDTGLGSQAFYQFSTAGGIPDGRYAIMPPSQMAPTGADGYWDFGATDHTTGTANGAMMVLNAGDKFNQFYRRAFEVQPGKSYRISVWRYVVNGNMSTNPHGPVYWDLEVQQVNSEAVIGRSGNIGNTVKNQWEQSSWDFIVPLSCDAGQASSLQATMALRNKSPVTGGNDIYIDDISVQEIPNAIDVVECPTELVYEVVATPDEASAQHNTSVVIPVLANDEVTSGAGVPGNVLLNTSLKIMTQPANGTLLLNVANGTVTYTPKENYSGTDQFTYQICNNAANPVCDTAIVTVHVSAGTIAAVDDSATVTSGQTVQTVLNVLAGDTLAGQEATIANVTVNVVDSPSNSAVLSLNSASGDVTVAANTPPGAYTLEYRVCERNATGNCDTATATVHVSAGPIAATDDSVTVVRANVAQEAGNVLDGDTLAGADADASMVTISVATNAGNSTALSLDATTGALTLAAGTPAGIHTLEYRICEIHAPSNCDSAVATVYVSAGEIVAVDSSETVTHSASAQVAGNVLGEDNLNGTPATIGNVSIRVISNPGNSPELSVDTATGQVTVAAGTVAGSYTLNYQICEINAPSNCDSATATVNVSAGLLQSSALSQTVTFSDTDQNPGHIREAFSFDGTAPALWDALVVAVATPAAPKEPGSPVPSVNPETGEIGVPANTPAGTYSIELNVCERAVGQANCALVVVEVVVKSVIHAVNASAPPIRALQGGQTENLLRDNILNGSPVNLDDVVVVVSNPAQPLRAGASVPELDVLTGLVTVPVGTPAGAYTIGYQMCDRADEAVCDEAVLTILVVAEAPTPVPVNHPVGLLLAGLGVVLTGSFLRRHRKQ